MIKLFLILGLSFFDPSDKDSIGIETINGKTFILHKVDEKETLFAISRRYKSSVDAIVQQNPDAATSLEIGQILRIPYTPKPKPDGTVHKVAPKETLYSISRLYGVSTDELKQWNDLKENALSVGHELVIKKKSTSVSAVTALPTEKRNGNSKVHIVAEKETLYSIARQYGVTVDEIKQGNQLQTNDVKIGQELVISGNAPLVKTQSQTTTVSTEQVAEKTKSNQTASETAQKESQVTSPANETTTTTTPVVTQTQPPVQQTIKISESVRNGDEMIETGLAELIEGTEGNRKYLALHRTAQVGTILKVRNEMNNREVFVRVMGRLPDTGNTDKLIIRISKSAYDRLGAIDPRFRVEVTYYK
jgi:LysM repeat protein